MKKNKLIPCLLFFFIWMVVQGQESEVDAVEKNVLAVDILDTEPKFLDYSFLEPKKKKKKKTTYNSNTPFKDCMQRHLRNNFRYPEIAQENKIQGRVEIKLLISKEGNLTIGSIEGESPVLVEEATRIISLLPNTVIPGRKDDKAVDSQFSFPLTFRLQ